MSDLDRDEEGDTGEAVDAEEDGENDKTLDTEEEIDKDAALDTKDERDEDKNQLERSGPKYTAISRSCSEAFVTKLIIPVDVLGRNEGWIQFVKNLQTPMSATMNRLVLPATWMKVFCLRIKHALGDFNI